PVEIADRALDPLGLPMRPFKLLDLVGVAVALHVLETLHAELGERFPLSPGLAALRDSGTRLSVRDGSVDPAIQHAFGTGDSPLDETGVRHRVLDGLAEELGAMLDEGVVEDVRAVDLCMILGAGWPIANGGLAPLLDREGVSERVLGRRLLADGVANVART
ncbi:MAG: 3-hydroxyacyl-CoA dehydrogenase family protein, partial [Actinomycetota bacterium]|nr:3-hydroxyacyl-CoA dehydrogenase family protein [Actinomycetota bacterium]